jgi:chromosome partitioning protein
VVPYIPDYLSLSGLNIFARQLRKFQKSVVAHDPKMSEPKIRAVIVNRFKAVGNVFSEAIVTLKGQLGFLRQAQLVDPGAAVLTPSIRDCAAVAQCSNEHRPVTLYKPDAIGAKDYQTLTTNFVFFFNRYEPK